MWWTDLEGKLNATDIEIVTQRNVVEHLKLDMKGTHKLLYWREHMVS